MRNDTLTSFYPPCILKSLHRDENFFTSVARYIVFPRKSDSILAAAAATAEAELSKAFQILIRYEKFSEFHANIKFSFDRSGKFWNWQFDIISHLKAAYLYWIISNILPIVSIIYTYSNNRYEVNE